MHIHSIYYILHHIHIIYTYLPHPFLTLYIYIYILNKQIITHYIPSTRIHYQALVYILYVNIHTYQHTLHTHIDKHIHINQVHICIEKYKVIIK